MDVGYCRLSQSNLANILQKRYYVSTPETYVIFCYWSEENCHPYHFALINEWFITVESDRKTRSYGYLTELGAKDLAKCDQFRKEIGLRSVETHNRLIDIQEQTGMWFYLSKRE